MNNEEFYIGQIFKGMYPPEAAIWCNSNNAMIIELESEEKRKYQIVEVPEPTPQEKIMQRVAELKAKLDDTDWIINKISEAEKYRPEQVSELIEKYRPIAEERDSWRLEINSYENQLEAE